MNIEKDMRLDDKVLRFDIETSLLEAYRVKPDIKDFPPTLIVYVNNDILFVTIDKDEKIPVLAQSKNQKFRIELIDKNEINFVE